jgi:hypothetical protein
MPDGPGIAEPVLESSPRPAPAGATPGAKLRKRWRAWLRAVHRDTGYLAVGFTVIYALSGIAMNHIEDWDPNFHTREITRQIPAIADNVPDAEAIQRVAAASGLPGKVTQSYRTGDEIGVTFENDSKATAIGPALTIQSRRDRMFFRVADWLHASRGKQAWKYIADAYAVLLLYLAVSGLFMIKGRLGLRWRGAALVAIGVAVPVGYIVLSGNVGKHPQKAAAFPGEVDPVHHAGPATPPSDGITPLPSDDDGK